VNEEVRDKTLGIRLPVPLLALAGMGISGYLTYIHYKNINAICLFNAKCDAVLTSSYAQIWGIPLALFGLALYAALAVLGFLSLNKKLGRADLAASGIYGLALSGILFSLYLYYLEIFEIHAFCTWCITSSIVMLAIFILSLINLRHAGFNGREFRRWLSRYVQW